MPHQIHPGVAFCKEGFLMDCTSTPYINISANLNSHPNAPPATGATFRGDMWRCRPVHNYDTAGRCQKNAAMVKIK